MTITREKLTAAGLRVRRISALEAKCTTQEDRDAGILAALELIPDAAPPADDEPPCTICGDTGYDPDMERRCHCQPAPPADPDVVGLIERAATVCDHIAISKREGNEHAVGMGAELCAQALRRLSAAPVDPVAEAARVLPETLTPAQIDSACLTYRHNFRRMCLADQDKLRSQAEWWWAALSRALSQKEPRDE